MKKAILLFTFIVSGLVSTQIFAQETNICRVAGTVIIFGNGIATSKIDAKFDLIILEAEIRNSNLLTEEELNNDYIFDLSYNPTDGCAGDLWESTKQDLLGDVSQFWRYISRIDIMPNWFQDTYAESAAELDRV